MNWIHARRAAFIPLAVLTAACAPGTGEEAEPAAEAAAVEDTSAQNPLPPGAEDAQARLNESPRHGEYAMVPVAGGDSVRVWVVYPERADDAPVVLVVHEIYGLTHWIRSVADQLAAEGFIAIAPDLLSGQDIPTDPSGDPQREPAVAAVRALDRASVHERLATIADWGMALPAATDRYGIVGFCWGGTVSFTHGIEAPELDAAVVYYGSSPDSEELEALNAPVLGLYGGDDQRVNATIPAADSAMQALGRTFETHIYDGAGHGFLRQQAGNEGANMDATRQAWPRTIAFFREHLEP